MIEIAPKTYHPILRQNGHNSMQPRFKAVTPSQFFHSLYRFVNDSILDEPAYGDQSRDAWLRSIWRLEPYLAGVINSVTNIDKNRGWTVTGGRNQVKRFTNILHNRYFFAPDLDGWRVSFGGSALSYYTSDIGSVTEIGRQGSTTGPVDSLYFVDPARCWLTGNIDNPLKYRPNGVNKDQLWGVNDYFRVVSLPNTDEALYGLGFCALSRCIELAKIMVGIYQYDNEMLLNKAPRGLLLLKGITQEQWEDAMAVRTAKLEGDRKTYYGAVHVLASMDPSSEIEASLTALSSLPAEFDQRTFTDLLMYGYALCFGYDPREFWPVSGGSLGTATETEAQHRKGGAKGGLDYTLGYAEKINGEFPDTVLFEFEERDLDGELANAEADQAKADVITSLYESGLKDGQPLIQWEEGRILLAEQGLIPAEWTENQEETVADDEGVERALQNERVQQAIFKYPDEPIVQYKFSVKNGREQHQWRTLVQPQRRKRSFLVNRSRYIRRQVEEELALYQDQLDLISEQANTGEIDQADYEDRLEALTIAMLVLAMARGIEGENEAERLLVDSALLILEDDTFEAMDAGLINLTDQQLLLDAFPADAVNAINEEVDGSLQSNIAVDIYAGQYDENAQGLLSRLTMWTATATGLYYLGRMIGKPEQLYEWRLGATIDHCDDCQRLNGQVHTGAEWRASGYRPQGRNLACTGRHCKCGIYESSATQTSGNF